MARRNLDEAMEKYKSDAGEFFKLENDKDASIVRFLHEGTGEDIFEFDVDWFIVHEVEIDGVKRYVRCPETSDCRGCKRLRKPFIKLFIQLVEKNDPDKRKVWERGQKFIPTIRELVNQYGELCNRPYDIERNGAAGDRKTTYSLYPMDRDDKRLRDLPVERQKLLDGKNGLVLDLTNDEFDDAIDGRLRLKESDSGGRDRDRGGRDRGGRDNRDDRYSRRDSDRGGSRRDAPPSDRDAPPDRGESRRGSASKKNDEIF